MKKCDKIKNCLIEMIFDRQNLPAFTKDVDILDCFLLISFFCNIFTLYYGVNEYKLVPTDLRQLHLEKRSLLYLRRKP